MGQGTAPGACLCRCLGDIVRLVLSGRLRSRLRNTAGAMAKKADAHPRTDSHPDTQPLSDSIRPHVKKFISRA